LAIGLILVSPMIWVAWWLIDDLGEKVSGEPAIPRYMRSDRRQRRAAWL